MITREELETYRRRLLALGSRVCGDRSLLKGEAFQTTGGETSGSFSDTPLHPADLGSHHFEVELSLTLLENEELLIEEINAALERIEQGTFGDCEACHQPIKAERLQVLPFTRHCLECARSRQGKAPE